MTSFKDPQNNSHHQGVLGEFRLRPQQALQAGRGSRQEAVFFNIFIFLFPFRQEATAADRQVEDEKRDRPEKSVAWRTQRSDRGELHALCKTSSSQVSFKPESGEQGDLETGHCANVVKSAR